MPLWIAFALGRRAATRRYTYGYGRAEDLAGLFVVAMIALSAVVAGWESIHRLINPAPIDHLGWVAAAGLVGFVGNEAGRASTASASAARSAPPPWSPTACTPAPTASPRWPCVVGAAGVALGFPLADPIVGLLITVAILAVLRTAARDIFRRLMDAVDPDLVDAAEASAGRRTRRVKAVRSVRMRWIGHRLHADAELDIDPDTTPAPRPTSIAHDAEHTLTHAVPKLTTALVHAYPAHNGTPAKP